MRFKKTASFLIPGVFIALLSGLSILQPVKKDNAPRGIDIPTAGEKRGTANKDTSSISTVVARQSTPSAAGSSAQNQDVLNPGKPIAHLPTNTEASLWTAFSEAQRAIHELDHHESSMEWNRGVRYFAQNPGQKLTSRFLADGVRIGAAGTDEDWQALFTSPGLGSATTISKSGTRVEYKRGPVTEWYDNRPDGIEQGFVVSKPLSEDANLRVKVHVDGLTVQSTSPDAGTIHLEDSSGQARLAYSKLVAWDADGTLLASRMEAKSGGIDLIVSAANARYPITIDPLVTSLQHQFGPDVPNDARSFDAFGYSVSVSGDTAIIGANLTATTAGIYAGKAYVFVRTRGVWNLQSSLAPTDAVSNDRFGYSVCVQENTAVIGAYLNDVKGSNAGCAYVFSRTGTTWSQQAKLLASDGSSNANFGNRVSLSGDYALIGADSAATPAGSYAGAAYVFLKTGVTWSQQAKLTASDGTVSDYFGSSVSIDGNTAAIGARLDDDNGNSSGGAYIFTRTGTNWTQQAKLLPQDGAAGDSFGTSISLSGSSVLVGAYLEDDKGTDAGAAYIFTRTGNTWTQQAKLSAGDGSANSFFGASASLEGDTALVGASWEKSRTGSAYVFTRSGGFWTQQTKLTASDAASASYFGISVSLSGDTALVGSTDGSTVAPSRFGSSYVFYRTGGTWAQTIKLPLGGDGTSVQRFGNTVSIDGDSAVIGAPYDATALGSDVGGAYIFTRTGTTWIYQKRIAASDPGRGNQFGISVAIDGDTALVGAWLSSTNPTVTYNTGAAYVFTRSGGAWSQQAKLNQSDVDSLDYFGVSVALEGNRALIGSYWDNARRGAAYIFERNGTSWTQQAKLSDPTGGSEHNFGAAVSISGTTALIGAAGNGDLGNHAGCAFVFVGSGSTWTQKAKLKAADGAAFNYFGASVAISGETLLVGAPGGSGGETLPGSAYFFTRSGDTWTQQAKVGPSDPDPEGRFGGSVAIEGNRALIGSARDDLGSVTWAGSVYVFGRNETSWAQVGKIPNPAPAFNDMFGASVSMSGDTALIGTPMDDGTLSSGDPAVDRGSVYVYVGLDSGVVATLSVPVVTDVTESSARFTANLNSNGGLAVTSRGFVYSATTLNPNPSIGGVGVTRVNVAGSSGELSALAESLSALTNYTIRAFAINAAGTSYSNPTVNFRTISCDPTITILSAAPAPVAPGQALVLALQAGNNGPGSANGIVVTSTLSAQLEFISATAPSGWTVSHPAIGSSGLVTFSRPSALATGGTDSLKIRARVRLGTSSGTIIQHNAAIATTSTDSDPANNVAVAASAVGTKLPVTLQLSTKAKLNRQTGLFEIDVSVTNTTPSVINGFRLNVDYSTYLKAHPTLGIQNPTGITGNGKAYIDHYQRITIGETVKLKLSIYTRDRKFPARFKPKLDVSILEPVIRAKTAARIAPAQATAAPLDLQTRLSVLANRTVELDFPATAGQWYRIEFSNDMVHWRASPTPVQATEARLRWIDSGPPFTDSPPAENASRFYRTAEIGDPSNPLPSSPK